MSDQKEPFNDTVMRQRAFSRWENEGGAPASGRKKYPVMYKKQPVAHENTKKPEEEKICAS